MCITAKQTHMAIGSGPWTQGSKPMHTLHLDMCGPMPVDLHSRKWYLIIDNHLCHATVYLLKKKSNRLSVFKSYFAATPAGRQCYYL